MTRIHTAFAAIGMLFVATSGLVAPALADVVVKDGSLRDVPHREVRYGDLNLDTQAGIDTLNTRLEVAVRAVCGPMLTHQLEEVASVHDCRDASLDRAFAARDEMMATRMAARENPGQLAAATPSLAVVARRGK
ncbi:UrcA family protein [Novosphingobium sp. PhB55]|uniref:UrcA family protein n=1 Tax=Novosphingobium sp. PhB55 TaxID=2485106 RepID=UPI0010EB572B|nr:UrcA family protein [Novosphingobium sp. PhB55]TDW63260.1 UrcA family protein [Novosphingobium sp. PhB55]